MAWGKNARALVCAAFALCAAGCAQPPSQVFDLAGASVPTHRSVRADGALSIREPMAVSPTSSNRIVLRDADGSVFVLPDVGWSAPLPRLLRERLIESLQKADVGAARIGGSGRALATDIRRFEIDVARNVAVVEIYVRILDENTGAARAAQNISAETFAPAHTGAAAALALTDAAAQALARIAAWARSRL
ncbi:ABC-type transport auxiliary lipoprotein family protein [Methylocystis parvus]|nr:ABC-type transport auxiliary lipoprotein family protein [Methylocystis parvus]WBJ99519.1 ABC-type transport auxiliary lipoprotein family protein [Methylocystis parvus OBBP]